MNSIKRPLVALITSGIAIAVVSLVLHSGLSISQAQPQDSVDTLQNIFKPKRRPFGTRGPICLITPGMRPEQMSLGEVAPLWSDRPLLLWQKPVTRVEVRLASSNRVVWNQMLPLESQRIVYQGPLLQPGQTYTVIAFGSNNDPLNNSEDAQFTLIEASQHKQISEELATTEAELKKQAHSAEEIAITKAIKFTKRGLLSDAFQTVDSLPNRSAKLNTFLKQVSDEVCGESQTALSNP